MKRVVVLSFGLALACFSIARPAYGATSEPPRNPEAVREIQSALNALGYFRSPVDGQNSTEFKKAARTYLEDAKVDRDVGMAGADMTFLRNALRDENARRQPGATTIVVAPGSPFSPYYVVSENGEIGAIYDFQSLSVFNVRTGHAIPFLRRDGVKAIDFSPDGKMIAIGTYGEVRLYDLVKNQFVAAVELPKKGDRWAPDEMIIKMNPRRGSVVIGDNDGRVFEWQYGPNNLRKLAQHQKPADRKAANVDALAIAPDGASVASLGSDNKLIVLSLVAPGLGRSISVPNTMYRIGFDASGQSIVGSSWVDKKTKLHKISLGSATMITADIPPDNDPKASKPWYSSSDIDRVVFSPDGTRVFVSSSDSIAVLRTSDFQLERRIKNVGVVRAVARDNRVALGSEGVVDLTAGTKRSLATGPARSDEFAIYAGKSRVYLSAQKEDLVSFDLRSGAVERSKILTSEKAVLWSDPTRMQRMQLRADDTLVDASVATVKRDRQSGSMTDTVKTLDLRTMRLTQQAAPKNEASESEGGFLVTPDGLRTITALEGEERNGTYPGFLSIYNIARMAEERRIDVQPLTACQDKCRRTFKWSRSLFDAKTLMTLSGTGRYVFAGYREAAFASYDIATGRRVDTFNTLRDIRNFVPEFRNSAQYGFQNGVLEKNAPGLLSLPSMLVSPAGSDDVYAVLGGDMTMSILMRQNFILRFSPGSSAPRSVIPLLATPNLTVVSRDQRRIALAFQGGAIVLIDGSTGAIVADLRGHSATAKKLEFSPDGRRLYTTAEDNTFRVWDTSGGGLLTSTYVFEDKNWLTLTPEGFFTGSAGAADRVAVHTGGLSVTSVAQVYQALFRPDLVQEKLAGDPAGKVREAATKLDLAKVIASGAAPTVRITSHADNAALQTDEATLEASIADVGGGIGRVEWRVNGTVLGVTQRGLARADGAVAGASRSVSQKLALEPGDNVIEVVAYNGPNLVASTPARVTLKVEAQNASPPKLHVLAVGVNDYWDSRLKLAFAVPDARAIGDALRQAGDGLYQSVSVTTVLDADVTREKIDKAFAAIGETVRPRDTFVFFLAGHGKTVDGRYFFLPQDFRYRNEGSIASDGIGQDAFQSWLSRIAARRSVLLYDTCESGSLVGERIATRGLERVAALERMTSAMGRTILSASTDDAPALEGYRGHGVFTYALLDGLAAADTNNNGMIEITELASFIDQKVPQVSYEAFKTRQIPQMKILGSNFPLTKKLAASPVSQGAATASAAPPTKPSHVVIAPSVVRGTANRDSAGVADLPAGAQVAIVSEDGDWAIVARDGRRLGYVEIRSLVRLQ